MIGFYKKDVFLLKLFIICFFFLLKVKLFICKWVLNVKEILLGFYFCKSILIKYVYDVKINS